MKLKLEFESARARLINRTPVPSLEVCLGELLCEEQRLTSQLGLAQDAGGSEMINVAYTAQGRGRYESPPQCYSYKEIGHIAKHCSKKFCNYCKKEGHIIKDCRYALNIDLTPPQLQHESGIDPLPLFILLFSSLVCLHLSLYPLFRVFLTLLLSRFNK